MKPIHVSNLEAMIGRWRARIDELERFRDTRHWRPDFGIVIGTIQGVLLDLKMEIQREQDRQVELGEVENG